MIYVLISTAYSLPILFNDSSERKSRIQMAAGELGLPPNLLTLAAAHAWDIANGIKAECMTAFWLTKAKCLMLSRQNPNPHWENINDLAKQLISQRKRWSA